jgi:DNA sulfur modification protein DndD
MMTISVIDALRRVSGIDAPVFLDTPGRSLDFKHKEELLNYFWKNEGHQFLIFAHSGEFDTTDTLEAHSDQLAKAWSLSWPGDHRNCYVCESENVEYNPDSKMNTCSKCGEKWDVRSNHTMIRELKF